MNLGLVDGFTGSDRTDAQIAEWFDLASSVRARWVRLDLAQGLIQPSSTSWNWSHADRQVAMAASRGRSVLLLADSSASWNRPVGSDAHYANPRDPVWLRNWVEYVRRLHDRYPELWIEVWNEPNLGMFWTGPTGPSSIEYSTLFTAVRNACPKARLITAGLAPAPSPNRPIEFATRVMESLRVAKVAVNGIGLHPYWPPNDPNWLLSPFYQAIEMAALLPVRARIWATEMGVPTTSGGISENAQAEQMTAKLLKWNEWQTEGWAGPGMIYRATDDGSGFSLLRADGSERPVVPFIRKIQGR